MNISKNLFKSSIIYFVGQVLSKIISFLLLPLYTNYISTSNFGFYDLSISILGVAVPVLFMEIWTGTLRFSIEQKTDKEKRRVINNSMIIGMISYLLYTFIYIVAAYVFKFDLPIWIYVYSFIWVQQLFLLSVARIYERNALYAYSGVVAVFFNAIITTVAVLLTDGSVESLYIGMIISMLIQVLIINRRFKIFSNFHLKDYDSDLCKVLVRFSLPLSLNSVMYWMLEGFNKLVITLVLGIAKVGIYAIGNKISVILNLVITVFNLSWQETIFKITNNEEKEIVYNIGFNLLIKIVGAGLVVILPMISLMFPIIGIEYISARNLIPFLLLVIFVNAVVYLLASCFAAEKNTRDSMIAKIVSCVVNVIVLFSTINLIGLYSSPIAMLFANLAGIAVQIMLLKKHIVIKPNYTYIFLFVVMFSISTIIYLTEIMWMNLGWLVISGIFYCFYLHDFINKIIKLVVGMLPVKKGDMK